MSKPSLWNQIYSKLRFWFGQVKFWLPFLVFNRKCTLCDGVGSYNVLGKTGYVLHVTCKACTGAGWRKRWE